MVALTQGLGWPGNDFQPGITPLPAQPLVDQLRVYKWRFSPGPDADRR